MENSLLSQVFLPAALFIIMLGMGLSLVKEDFFNITKNPKSFILGVLCQLVLLPLIAMIMVILFSLESHLAVGLLVLAFCPGGVTSNMYSYLAKGNVALSISLTAIISFVTPFTIPILTNLQMEKYMGGTALVQLPLQKTIITLLGITIIPVLAGMSIKKKWPEFAEKADKTVKIMSILFLFIIVTGIAIQNWGDIPVFFSQVGWACFCLSVIALLVGFFTARTFKLPMRDAKTIGIEVGLQNGTTALFVTSTILNDPLMSVPAATYSLIMFGTGAVYSWYFSRTNSADEA